MTNDGVNTIVYDGENRATSSSNGSASGVYTYDGNGLRVQKVSGATTTVTIFSGGLDIAEYFNGAAPSAPGNEFIYVGSQRILLIQSGTNYYLHNDHLSLRVRTNSSGNIVDQRGHFPFGETWYSPSGAPLIFTSYYRDTESGNDYALARTYVNRLGRFSSPDPIAGDVGDPQSLNRYAYVRNSPTSSTDTTGLSPNNVHISAAYLMPGAGGDCVLDGVSIGCEDLMGGSGGAFATCPGNDCSPRTGSNGQLYPIVLEDDGFYYLNLVSGDTFGSGSELGLPSLDEGIFDPNTLAPAPAQGGPSGGSSGGASSRSDWRTRFADCTKQLYTIDAKTIVPATLNSNGNFIGDFQGKSFSVETDVGSYSSFALSLKGWSFSPLAGLTLASNPHLNYVANNLSPVELYPATWVHELGHSLDLITTGKSSEASVQKFEDCVKLPLISAH
jgi:RHS repeat-associated protein